MNFKRLRTAEFYITQKVRLEKGIAELNFVRYIGTIYVLIAASAFFRNYKLSNRFYALIGIFIFFFCWGIGYAWDKFKLFHAEAEFGNKRNPFVKQMLSNRKIPHPRRQK